MGNVIPWSEIHPSIKSEEPFVAVVIVDPRREICVSEMVDFEPEALGDPEASAGELLAAAQAAAARVAAGYRQRRKAAAPKPEVSATTRTLRVLRGGLRERA
jgi:hypothetical protein